MILIKSIIAIVLLIATVLSIIDTVAMYCGSDIGDDVDNDPLDADDPLDAGRNASPEEDEGGNGVRLLLGILGFIPFIVGYIVGMIFHRKGD